MADPLGQYRGLDSFWTSALESRIEMAEALSDAMACFICAIEKRRLLKLYLGMRYA